MKLIVGLGNPGKPYAYTRHNAGFMLVDKLASRLGAGQEKKQCHALVRTADAGADRILLAKPQLYMNLSGDPLWELINYYKGSVEDFIILHDDLDLPLGRIRFKDSGGTGGHKGLVSITGRLGNDVYDRLKIGIGRPPEGIRADVYVLQAFSAAEKQVLDMTLETAGDGLLYWLTDGCTRAMNKYNAADTTGITQNISGILR